MGTIQCDILTGDDICCIFVRFVDTTHEKIKSFKSPERFEGGLRERVTHILFYRGILPTFPSEINNFFPNLKSIDIFDCKMEKICRDDIKDFQHLEKIKIESNNIKYLPGNLFEFSPKITHFSFADNNISKIGQQLLDPLDHLIDADFTRNKGLNYHYYKNITGNLEQLKKIIKEDCKPLRSLQIIAVETLKKNMNSKNFEDIKLIANILKINDLLEVVDEYLKLE